jgi:hypothetical protein
MAQQQNAAGTLLLRQQDNQSWHLTKLASRETGTSLLKRQDIRSWHLTANTTRLALARSENVAFFQSIQATEFNCSIHQSQFIFGPLFIQ